MPKNINVANQAFYSNNFVFNIVGHDVYIDFQKISPRYHSEKGDKAYTVKEHSTIIMNVTLFKDLILLASNQLKALEGKFGEITPSEFIKNLSAEQQKEIEKAKKKPKEKKNGKPPYFG